MRLQGPAAVLLVTFLSSCGSPDGGGSFEQSGSAGGPAEPIAATFACGPTRVDATFVEESLRLATEGRSYGLQRAISASGARYTGETESGPIEFWNKGREATLTIGDRTYPTCREVRDHASEDSKVYVARGNEPGWLLHADGAQLVLEIDYGATKIEAPTPEKTQAANGFTYTATNNQHQVVVEVRHNPCVAPSGVPLRDTVTVRVGDRTLRGCGGGPLSDG